MPMWAFGIDVGGTFTDCVARAPDGRLISFKLLSTGNFQGRVEEYLDPVRFVDPGRMGDPEKFWIGWRIRFFDGQGRVLFATRVQDFDTRTGRFSLAAVLPHDIPTDILYELHSGLEAPVVAIRYLLGLLLNQPIPAVDVRLGTTRGTNALLTRRGARTAFVTTRGFRDALRIGTQDRPRLFDLDIQKPEPLYEVVVEIDERLDAQGQVLHSPDPAHIREQLQTLRDQGILSVAICLLHAYLNPAHEELVAEIAREVGFVEISVSHRLAPLIKLVSRGETSVLDAYLNPILRDYLQRLRSTLGESSLRVMSSAGGLESADHFVGKDSLLSGPAGGVIGYARVACEAGFDKAIGFDMGGTSTDVSRFAGRYEMEYESRKAGVRVVSPMLAIETVAAGGGSLCEYDGVKLVVGPGSAGADPGPACYGRGGPLTITDMNYFLGKILSRHFPFPLYREIVSTKLQALCDRIAQSPDSPRYTPEQLAEGFLQVANANMVRPIRNISVAKGYDPRDYVLVTFGGAGGQHACALARALGVKHILSHPFAGILSAHGIGLADIRKHRAQAVLKPYSPAVLQDLESLFQQLEQATREEVLAEGIAPQNIAPARFLLDLRYQGQETTLSLEKPGDGDYHAAFLAQHRQLYGYVHEGRPLEITAARVEVVGRTPLPTTAPQACTAHQPEPREWTSTWFHGQACQTAVFLRADLQPGAHITGPAIICEPTSTVLVDPGFSAEIRSRGEIVLTDAAHVTEASSTGGASATPITQNPSPRVPLALPVPQSTEPDTTADPIRLEIFNNLFASIAEQMGTTLQRTALSTNVKERLDFSCAMFSPRGDLVVNAPHIPVHLGAMGETVRRTLADNPDMAPGDVYITNDPYRGGSHLPDVTVISPVHHPETGELLFLTASRAHHAEIGGIVPGSMPPFSRNLAEEGVLIRNFKLVAHGQSREEELRQLLLSGTYPTRNVRDNLADIAAQVAANQSGARQLIELVRTHSQPVVQAYMGHIQRAAETKMRLALRRLPEGEYTFTDHFDDGTPLSVRITIAGDSAHVDFTGPGPLVAGNLNANTAIVTAAVLYVFRCLIREEIPLNAGVLAPVTITVPPSLLNPPAHEDPAQCAAVVGGNVEVSQKVVDVLLGALKLAAASQGTMNNLTFGNGRFGYYETICGGAGATPQTHGASAVHTHMTNTRLTDPEVLERRFPVRLWEFSIRPDSGGAGQHRGGDGIIRRLEFLEPLRVSIISERRERGPFGLDGGTAGQPGRNLLCRAGSNTEEDLGGKVQFDAQPGDQLTIQTPGGGGWGEDKKRMRDEGGRTQLERSRRASGS